MAKRIVGGVAGVPNPYSDWNQTDPNKADYIKNKPNLDEKADKSHVDALEETILRNEEAVWDLQNEKADKEFMVVELDKKADADYVSEMAVAVNDNYKFIEKVDIKVDALTGDIETSLDNIIKKYGLGGDGV